MPFAAGMVSAAEESPCSQQTAKEQPQGPVNIEIYEGLLMLQHRGQDSAGMVTLKDGKFIEYKANGLVKDVFNNTKTMDKLQGNPLGMYLVHNGNITNTAELKVLLNSSSSFFNRYLRTDSDSEVLLNVLADEIHRAHQRCCQEGVACDPTNHKMELVFEAGVATMKLLKGAYSCISMIAGVGLIAFRDPFGIRPLVLGRRTSDDGDEWCVASEDCAFGPIGFQRVRDVLPGEMIVITEDGWDIDCVVPVPDGSRPAAIQMSAELGLPYREGLVKNRYVGRTFIMPDQRTRELSVRRKLNAMPAVFSGKSVLLVDDSIVRGTTMSQIVDMVRKAGAKKVYLASASPPVRYPNVYGVDMPTKKEFVATDLSEEEIRKVLGADGLLYQSIDDLLAVAQSLNPDIQQFEASCFTGHYVTEDISPAYLQSLESSVRLKDRTRAGEKVALVA
ncbi:MAG: amidophosphoribosyltransferase [Trebouxia sp. A1-2]|nr:MAG: amidophosphoribosyltransferase [Trebouxia sp. A1-2]